MNDIEVYCDGLPSQLVTIVARISFSVDSLRRFFLDCLIPKTK